MFRPCPRVLVGAILLLAALSTLAEAEYLPPPRIDDLLRADCAVIGHFVEREGAVAFEGTRMLWGDVGIVDVLCKDEDFRVRVEEDGRLTAWTWGSATGVVSGGIFCAEDATQRAIWLFYRSEFPLLVAQPVELTDGFLSLRRARGAEPPAIFRLIQRLDYDMRREAMEDLVAGRNREALAELHRLALAPDSLAHLPAMELLIETRLLDADRFWGCWTGHPEAEWLLPILKDRDPDRVTRELRNAIEAETQPARLDGLLYLAREDVDTSIRYLGHDAPEVRDRALGNLHARLWVLAREPAHASELKALAARVLPLLEARRRVETSEPIARRLDGMLEEKDGVPFVVRAPAAAEPPARYTESKERAFVVSLLTSSCQGGFAMESAGREIAEQFFADGFERLRKAAASPNYNTDLVYEGMGYVRHPAAFAHLVERAKTVGVGDDAFPAMLRAIGRQNEENSFEALKGLIEQRLRDAGEFAVQGAFDALGLVSDERALDMLRGMRDLVTGGGALNYVRARAAHGDGWAIHELMMALLEPSECEILQGRAADDVIGVLLLVDTPEATEAILRSVESAWPTRWEAFDEPCVSWCMGMENYAGDSRRTTALGEAARRDPRRLAGLALARMESPSLTARVCGAYIFRGLTGRSFGFDAEAFAAERAAPLHALHAWWTGHGSETREQWLLSYFREKGFPMARLAERASLPELVRALEADPVTHDLAVERISVITGKYFTQPTLRCGGATYYGGGGGYGQMDQEHTTARVTGWLVARKLLPAER